MVTVAFILPASGRATSASAQPQCASAADAVIAIDDAAVMRSAHAPPSSPPWANFVRFSDDRHVLRGIQRRAERVRVGDSSGHANCVEYRSGPNGQPSVHPAVSLGTSSPTPSPDECRAICETSSMVGKCRAIATARCLTAIGRLSSRASSIRKPPPKGAPWFVHAA